MTEPSTAGPGEPDATPPQTAAAIPQAPMSVWGRLKEHKVAQWAVAYAAAAYTLLHGTEMVSSALHWPELVVRLTLITLVLGLPVVALLAWYHGHKAQHRISGPELSMLAALLLVAGSVLWYLASRTDERAPATAATAPAAILDKSIAVLPFVNLSSSSDDEYFAEGLADTLLRMLSQVPELKVIARTSSFKFKGNTEDVRSIGQQLGTATLLEGSLQRSGDQLRVIAQLINTRDGTHVWSQTYDRKLTDVFAVQDEIASQVAAALSTSLIGTAKTVAKHTPSVEAYQEYLRGRQLLTSLTSDSSKSAAEHFQKAIDLDANYALAYVGYAEATAPSGVAGSNIDSTAGARANSAIQRALRLDPNLSEAWKALGDNRQRGRDDIGVDQAYQRAIEINPGNAAALASYGDFLVAAGRFLDAKTMIQHALVLDPLTPDIQRSGAYIAWYEGRADECLRYLRRALELDPQFASGYFFTGAVYSRMGRLDEAIRYMKRAAAIDHNPAYLNGIASYSIMLGEEDLAEQTLREMEASWPNTRFSSGPRAYQDFMRGRFDTAAQRLGALVASTLDVLPVPEIQLLTAIDLDAGRHDTALARLKAMARELADSEPQFNVTNSGLIASLARAFMAAGQREQAQQLLAAAEPWVRARPRSSVCIGDCTLMLTRILTLEGKQSEALAELRAAIDAGDGYDWPIWSKDGAFAAIADAPQFKQCVEIVKARNVKQLQSLRERPELAPT